MKDLLLSPIPRLLVGAALLALAPVATIAEESLESDEAWLNALLGLDENDEALLFAEMEEEEDTFDKYDEEELRAALQQLTSWEFDATIDAGVGMKSNVLYSAENEQESAFFQSNVDVFLLKPGLDDRPELLAIFYGELRLFDDVPGLSTESLAFLHTQASKQYGNGWKPGIGLAAVRSEQALDASIDEFETEATTVKVFRPSIQIKIDKEFETLGAASARFEYAQSGYSIEGEDYDERIFGLSWKRRLSDRSNLELVWERFMEEYDEKLERSTSTLLSEAPLLEIEGDRFRAQWNYRSDGGALRRLQSRVLVEREDDALGDYYERERWQLRERAEFQFGVVKAIASISYAELDYLFRPVEVGGHETRSDEDWRYSLRLEHDVREDLSVFLDAEYADKRSNVQEYTYDSSMVVLGLSYSGFGAH